MDLAAPLPRPRREPRVRANSRTGIYHLHFYDGQRQPSEKAVSLSTRDRRRAERAARPYIDAWMARRWDPWTDGAFVRGQDLLKAIEEYHAYKRDRGDWTAKTGKDRRKRLERFAATLPKDVTVAMVRPEHVESFLDRPPMGHDENARNVLNPEKLSPNARRAYHSHLKTFFAWAVDRGYADRSPVGDVDRPKPPRRKEPVHLTPDQLSRLIEAVRADYDAKQLTNKLRGPHARQLVYLIDVFELAAYTGLRPGELRRLRWRDVDLERGVLHVRDTPLGKVKRDSHRSVPILSPARTVLERLAAARPTEDDDHTVLTSPKPDTNGQPKPISLQTVSRHFREYARSIGLDGVSLYALRRTTATWLASSGAPIQVAQRVLGHSSIRTTADFYASVWGDTVRDQAEAAMAKALSA
ncbi:MAG TPA: site-specific integrase [Bacteroidetes bacterium]|nr:site-specific integrase [Bacteroidota bacterium]